MRDTLVHIVEGVWVDPWDVKVIKKISDNSCAFWVTGQSAMDGFVLDYPAEDVVQAIEDARESANTEDVDEDESEQE